MPGRVDRHPDDSADRDLDVAQQFGNYRSSPFSREEDYDDRGSISQRRGRYADPKDQGHEPRDRWQGSGGSRWDENDERQKDH